MSEETWADEVRGERRPFWVQTAKGVYAGSYPAPAGFSHPPDIEAMIAAGDERIRWRAPRVLDDVNAYVAWNNEEDARAECPPEYLLRLR